MSGKKEEGRRNKEEGRKRERERKSTDTPTPANKQRIQLQCIAVGSGSRNRGDEEEDPSQRICAAETGRIHSPVRSDGRRSSDDAKANDGKRCRQR